ncbi:hypothetical protein [Lamprocystis purpurea]|uniref:hypothetical protein n=1 Tax=Lamprocystis purpurea TaxID=61598 RepID=UPI00146F0270|nr:hypothetical protein [Lamprocystis purpurea]
MIRAMHADYPLDDAGIDGREMHSPEAVQFDVWEAVPTLNLQQCCGKEMRVEPKAMESLVYLARHAGTVVSRRKRGRLN